MNKPENNRKPTVRDIAESVGVSTTTVINVMKGRASEVSPATAKKINETAQRLGYVKNLTAAALSTRQSHVIAVVVSGVFQGTPHIQDFDINPFYGDFAFRLEHEARSRGYSISLYAGDDDGAIPFLLQRQYDAVVVLGTTDTNLTREASRYHLPIILMDSFVPRQHLMCVCGEEMLGGSIAARHLIQSGRKRLAFVGDVRLDKPMTIPTLRYQGALAACQKARATLDPLPVSTSFEGGAGVAPHIIAQRYDGVVVAADVVAAGLVQGLRHAGASVPDQVAVVGYDNLLLARTCLPTLTTVDQRISEKIRAAMDLVQKPSPGARVVVRPTLVVRESA